MGGVVTCADEDVKLTATSPRAIAAAAVMPEIVVPALLGIACMNSSPSFVTDRLCSSFVVISSPSRVRSFAIFHSG
jgi:hypothetical protein